MYLSLFGVLREVSNRSVLRSNGRNEGSEFVCSLVGATSVVEINPLSNYPNAAANH